MDRIIEALRRVEPALKELAADNRDFRNQLTEMSIKLAGFEGQLAGFDGRFKGLDGRFQGLDGRLAGIEGRLSQIPNVWQTIAILATLLIGLSGVLLTASRFFHP